MLRATGVPLRFNTPHAASQPRPSALSPPEMATYEETTGERSRQGTMLDAAFPSVFR